MPVTVITPPSPIVSINEMERHLADLPEEDSEYVETLIAAATGWIDGPSGWLGRSIGVQLLEARLGGFPCDPIRLHCPPIIEIDSISYQDVNGQWQTLDAASYELRDAYVGSAWGMRWPSTRAYRGSAETVRIRYWAGYGRRDPNDREQWINEVPAPIRVAIMMLVAQWYNTRENVIVGATPTEMPFAVDALLQPFRIYR